MGRLSAFPKEILKKLATPEIMEFLVRHEMLNTMQQSLLILAAVGDDVEGNLSATSDVVEWLCHFQDIMYYLEEVLEDKFGFGESRDALFLIFLGRVVETITNQKRHLVLPTEKRGERIPIYGRDKEKVEMINFLLSDRVTCVLAIVGTHEIGKTTLANVVYGDDRVKDCFELRGWVECRQELDAESLAKVILDRFKADFHFNDNLQQLLPRLRSCLSGKKFLLVLDDCQSQNVENWENLWTCFAHAAARGSVVILTTRRVEVALEMHADHVLHLDSLSLEDSCALFSEHAFGDGDLDSHSELESLTRQIVRKLGGSPLAVKKLGSLLYDHRDFHMWTKLLKIKRSDLLNLNLPPQLSGLPNWAGELRCLEHLDLSFSEVRALPESMSALSCLQTIRLSFCPYLRELPSSLADLISLRYLDIRGTNLREMSLQMGRLKNLHTLIGFIVSMKNGGSNMTELASISNIQTLGITEMQNMVLAHYALEANLKEKWCLDNLILRWNQLYPAADDQALEYLEPPKQLKTLEILGCPVRKFPNWLGDASFRTLEVLHLRDCRNCFFLPPVGQLSSLKVLSIQGCDNVRSIGTEFYGETTSYVPFNNLEILWIVDMPNWREWILFDIESLQFPCLRELHLIHCPQLVQDLPKHLPSLEKLEISECDRLVASIPKISDNHELRVQEQDSGEVLMTSVAEGTSESSLPHDATKDGGTITSPLVTNSKIDELISGHDDDDDHDDDESDFKSFDIAKVTDVSQLLALSHRDRPTSIRIEGCQFLESFSEELLSGLDGIFELFLIDCCSLKHSFDALVSNSLRTLYIHKCRNLEFIIPLGTHKKFAFLEHLFISSSCESLRSISINIFPRLRTLYIRDCSNLQTFILAEGLHDQNLLLESLEIRDCPNLISFPREGLPTPKLISISISNCTSLKLLPNHMAALTSLKSLLIDRCPEVESFPDGGLPFSLNLLSIAFSDKLVPQKEWNLQTLHSLTHFEIESGCIGMKSFPDKDLLPRNLKSLHIRRLSSLRVLNGKGLQHLTALETLEISCCHRLYSWPEEGLPSSLTCLCIKECPILTQKLYEAGADWSKIAYIPNLQIDDSAGLGVKKAGYQEGKPLNRNNNSREGNSSRMTSTSWSQPKGGFSKSH